MNPPLQEFDNKKKYVTTEYYNMEIKGNASDYRNCIVVLRVQMTSTLFIFFQVCRLKTLLSSLPLPIIYILLPLLQQTLTAPPLKSIITFVVSIPFQGVNFFWWDCCNLDWSS